MPTYDFSFKDFCKLVGKRLPKNKEKLWDKLLYVKAEIEEFEGDTLKVEEADTNRPDLWCVEGLSRALRGALGIEKGLPKYNAKPSNYKVVVDKSVKKIRPFIASAVVKGVKFNDYLIKQLIQLQLKLDTTFGRRRKKSAIGIYDFDKIKFPVYYKAVKPDSIRFVPLGFNEEMNLNEILENHPKGIEFGDILKSHSNYPILIDSEGKVLSMPPIINSNDVGRVTKKTKNVFVEITGTNFDTVMGALNIVASVLADRGGKVSSVTVVYGRKKVVTPNFSPWTMKVKVESIKKVLGLDLSSKEIKEYLMRARYGVKKINNKVVEVLVPFYRTDVMHEIDVIEDIGIMYGYSKIKSDKITISTEGGLLPLSKKMRMLRKLVIGMGYQEVLNYYRTDKEILFDKDCIEIANPLSNLMNVLRNELLPVELNLLSKNVHNEYPQKVFEIGRVFLKRKGEVVEENHLSMVSCHSDANFTEIKQEVEWLLRNLGVEYEIREFDHQAFIPGRCASVVIDGKVAGYFGELHPKTLTKFGLNNPAVAFEYKI